MNDLKNILEQILKHLSDDFELEELEFAGQNILHIKTEKDSKLLIGQKGKNLRALDYILSKIAKEKDIKERFLIDVNEYKLQEIKKIEEKARLLANRAKTLQYDVEMPQMSAYERLIVHACLKADPQIKTESHGEGKDRRLVIKFIA